MINASLLGLISISWNFLSGYCGQISFGHAAIFGTSAYISSILTKYYFVSPWLGILISACSVVIFALVVGVPSFRLHGAYFALVMLAYAHVLKLIAMNLSITKGDEGIFSIPSFGSYKLLGMEINFFTDKAPNFFLIFSLLIIVLGFGFWLKASNTGLAMEAIREDQDSAEAMGISSFKYKMIALGISAFFTAIGGTFYAHYIHFLMPDTAYAGYWSLMPIIASLLGGLHTITGPVVGAFVLVLMDELVFKSIFTTGDKLVYGLLVVITILFFPEGIVGYLKKE